jgi:hypothetical protein
MSGKDWDPDQLSKALTKFAMAQNINLKGFDLACLILKNIDLSTDAINAVYEACTKEIMRHKPDRKLRLVTPENGEPES